jgi:tRNA threonylcarbamoyladenosine biosynthesis protein TsaB
MNLLAIDTSTETMSLAVSRSAQGGAATLWQHTGVGGARASTHLIGEVMALLQQADLTLAQLDAICFGSGPGAFTGLRTACAVAQGLGYGAGVPVLAVDSLLAVAQDARGRLLTDAPACHITALLDARMGELYAATWSWTNVQGAGGQWAELNPATLLRPEDLRVDSSAGEITILAGNVFTAYAQDLGAQHGGLHQARVIPAAPTATALLQVAPQLLSAGHGVHAALALPRYIRDKVAKTTSERAHEKAQAT